jgi:hypothetical protein
MTNPNGHPDTLVPSHPGNRSAERSSMFARRDIAQDPEVREMAAAIMAVPHVDTMDEVGAVEIARLIVLIDRIDADLARRGLTNSRGQVRSILDHRRRYSAQLERWLAAYGMTPASRAELLRDVATGGLAHEIARRRAAAREGNA